MSIWKESPFFFRMVFYIVSSFDRAICTFSLSFPQSLFFIRSLQCKSSSKRNTKYRYRYRYKPTVISTKQRISMCVWVRCIQYNRKQYNAHVCNSYYTTFRICMYLLPIIPGEHFRYTIHKNTWHLQHMPSHHLMCIFIQSGNNNGQS